jgi:hypothetical protein
MAFPWGTPLEAKIAGHERVLRDLTYEAERATDGNRRQRALAHEPLHRLAQLLVARALALEFFGRLGLARAGMRSEVVEHEPPGRPVRLR